MNRRTMLKTSATAGLGALIISDFGCGPSKEKAVRVAGFIIDITKESLPLLDLLGAHDLTELTRSKAIPALEKLKEALASADIPTSRTTLETVRGVLGTIETALLNLPDSPRITTVLGIIASTKVLLLTVEAFISAEIGTPISVAAVGASDTSAKVRKVLEATRQ